MDVGAHHPTWYSNTFWFYQQGWTGLNIDATPEVEALFTKTRPRDKFIQAVIGDGNEVEFTDFSSHAYSGVTSSDIADRAAAGVSSTSTRRVKTVRLADVLNRQLPVGQPIDFMSVDVEGYELPVLQSNDWSIYRPRAVLVEVSNAVTLAEVCSSPVVSFLTGHGYTPLLRTGLTVTFARSDLLEATPHGFRINA